MTVLYVDLSHHDVSRRKGTLPDWAAIRQATSPVMCARATYGDPQGYNPSSRYFRDLIAGARKAGFTLLGAYHNLVRGDQASINRQVDYLRREMDAAGANWAMLDVERYEELLSRGLHPRFEDAVRFCDRWRAVDKRVLTVYLPKWIWDGHMGRPDLRKLAAPLVASNYGSNPDGSPASVYRARGGDAGVGWNAYGNVTPTIWQFGSNVDCPGASGQTDLNAFRGSLAELRALLTGTPQEDIMATLDEVRAAFRQELAAARGQIAEDTATAVLTRKFPDYVPAADGSRPPLSVSGALFATREDALRGRAAATASAAGVSELAGKDFTDEDAIADAVLARLGSRTAADVLKALAAAGIDLTALRAEMDRTAGGSPADLTAGS